MRSQRNSPVQRTHYQHRATYYSKTQENFFKAYAKQAQFINKLNDLLNAIDKRKVTKLVDQIKQGNRSFRKYLNLKKILYIKIDDVITFQEMFQKPTDTNAENHSQEISSQPLAIKNIVLPSVSSNNLSPLVNPHVSPQRKSKQKRKPTIIKNFSSLRKSPPEVYSPLEKQMIKKGFMSLLQKLQTLKKDEFINQTQYLQGVLIRESQKLKDSCIDEDNENKMLRKGRKINAKKMSLCEEIDNEEKMNGLYPMIMKNIRQETYAIENAENTFSVVMKN